MSPRSEAITRNYLIRIREMRMEMLRRLEAQYRASIGDDIATTYEQRFIPQATRTVIAAHGGAATLTRAYLRAIGGGTLLGQVMPAKQAAVAATLVGVIPIILARIRDGATREEALTIGAAYVSRTADNEFSAVVDGEMERQSGSGAFAGWVGHSYNSKDDCVNNEGFHTFETKPYRHPSCRCDIEMVPVGEEPSREAPSGDTGIAGSDIFRSESTAADFGPVGPLPDWMEKQRAERTAAR